jgi:ubiquinone biosynthesis protein UbiJ
MLKTINAALQLLPKLDPQATALMKPLDGKSLTVVITDIDYTLSLNIENGILSADDTTSTNVLSGSLAHVTELVFNKNLQELIMADKLKYEGSLKSLKLFNDFFAALDIDIAYKISKLTGPIFANAITKPFTAANEYIKTSKNETIIDVKDYLTEERKTLISNNEVNIFFREVQVAKQSVDRIEAKLKLLKGLD